MTRYRGRLTPRALLSFLESRNWSTNDLGDKLGDVEQLERLGEELREYAKNQVTGRH